METRVRTLKFGDEEVLVSAVADVGARERSVRDKAVDALDAAQGTIESLALSTQQTLARLREAGAAPDSVEVELGLAFTVEGNVVIAGGSVGASVSVRLRYSVTP